MLATAFVEVKPFKDLTLKGNFGIDRNYQKRSVYMPKTTLYGQKTGGQADVAQYDKSDYLLELTANYQKRWGEHNFGALLGYSFQRFTDESLYAGNSQFLLMVSCITILVLVLIQNLQLALLHRRMK